MPFLSRGLYGKRKWNHIDLYQRMAGWWFLEVGSWTLEVELGDAKKVEYTTRQVNEQDAQGTAPMPL